MKIKKRRNRKLGTGRQINDYWVEGDTARLALTDKSGSVVGYVMIDIEDLPRVLEGGKWSINKRKHTDYASRQDRTSGTAHTILMHRFLIGCDNSFEVDHQNHNGLDNRKDNLRLCTKSKNQQNALKQKRSVSGFKGVSLDKRTGLYRVRIKRNGKERHLGTFLLPEDAARTYDAAAKNLFGIFAYLNFPDE